MSTVHGKVAQGIFADLYSSAPHSMHSVLVQSMQSSARDEIVCSHTCFFDDVGAPSLEGSLRLDGGDAKPDLAMLPMTIFVGPTSNESHANNRLVDCDN